MDVREEQRWGGDWRKGIWMLCKAKQNRQSKNRSRLLFFNKRHGQRFMQLCDS